jgi:hypothetical protein
MGAFPKLPIRGGFCSPTSPITRVPVRARLSAKLEHLRPNDAVDTDPCAGGDDQFLCVEVKSGRI